MGQNPILVFTIKDLGLGLGDGTNWESLNYLIRWCLKWDEIKPWKIIFMDRINCGMASGLTVEPDLILFRCTYHTDQVMHWFSMLTNYCNNRYFSNSAYIIQLVPGIPGHGA